MEKAAEQGSAIVAAVEGVERQWGNNFTAPHAFIETLRERMFKPSLSTIIGDQTRVAVASPSDPVNVAANKMRELQVNSVIVVTRNKIQGILTSKDILMRVVAHNLSPELTLVEKVMTPNPECVTVETTVLDALHLMHDGKFLHLPVLDKDGSAVACVDVLQITHAAISMVESSSGAVNDAANTMMQKFWDAALTLESPDDYDIQSEMSALLASDGAELGRYPSLGLGNSFAFKIEDLKGRIHRLNCCTENLDELLSTVLQRIGADNEQDRPQLLYEDDEGDKVLLATDGDLIGAVIHARSVGLKVLRLHLDCYDPSNQTTSPLGTTTTATQRIGLVSFRSGIFLAGVVLAGFAAVAYLKRSKIIAISFRSCIAGIPTLNRDHDLEFLNGSLMKIVFKLEICQENRVCSVDYCCERILLLEAKVWMYSILTPRLSSCCPLSFDIQSANSAVASSVVVEDVANTRMF
ncbi:CBS DOMAIN-CONTAINING PROTEIN CBSCBSPB3 [Salix viminalis]|uniref:CBS DOMAIN-CONTAINING PROTEIN CBSCBSPB3 n=1 Tax=Salix viminalis TaxID=40686 RepID=A0A9Q0SHS1_SALVM|nr:CBS DOMAIN-CONTAINING PROTEIN CBSCBSPB3 [Salix viminalis]